MLALMIRMMIYQSTSVLTSNSINSTVAVSRCAQVLSEICVAVLRIWLHARIAFYIQEGSVSHINGV